MNHHNRVLEGGVVNKSDETKVVKLIKLSQWLQDGSWHQVMNDLSQVGYGDKIDLSDLVKNLKQKCEQWCGEDGLKEKGEDPAQGIRSKKEIASDLDTHHATHAWSDVLIENDQTGEKESLWPFVILQIINAHNNDSRCFLNAISEIDALALIKVLKQFGADPNALTHEGQSMLQKVTEFSSAEDLDSPLFLALSDHGFKFSNTPIEQKTLHNLLIQNARYAGRGQTMKRERNEGVIRCCVEKLGANVNAKSSSGGWTALHFAAINEDLALVKYLIALGADVNVAKEDGFTPLHLAVFNGYYELSEFLLSMNARTDLENDTGNTPRDLALLEKDGTGNGDFLSLIDHMTLAKKEHQELSEILNVSCELSLKDNGTPSTDTHPKNAALRI